MSSSKHMYSAKRPAVPHVSLLHFYNTVEALESGHPRDAYENGSRKRSLVDRWGWDSAETLLPLTLPHAGGREEQRTRSILFGLFFVFFFPLNKHVETCVLTCIDIRLIYLALKTWFKRQEYLKLSLDYEQSLCFLIVRQERSEKNRPRESWPHESCCLGERTTAFVRPTFARPVFFAPLSTDYKKTKGLLDLFPWYMYIGFHIPLVLLGYVTSLIFIFGRKNGSTSVWEYKLLKKRLNYYIIIFRFTPSSKRYLWYNFSFQCSAFTRHAPH